MWLRGSSFFIRYYGPDRKQRTEFLCERDEKHHSRTCKAVRTLADVAMAKVNAESEKPSDGPELLVSDFFLHTYLPWVEANKKRSTILSYKQIWAQHLKSHFDSKTLGGYRTSDASKFLTGLAESGLGRNTISHVRSSMSGIFSHSVNLGLIDRNPVSEAKSLSKAKAPSETESHSLREVEDLISALAERPDCQLVVALCGFLGLRPSEVAGLQWQDVDLTNGIIYLRRGVVRGAVGDLKTLGSATSLPLFEPIKSIFAVWASKLAKRVWVFENQAGNHLDLRSMVDRHTFSSLPYSAAAATSVTSCPGGAGKTTTYDALTRPTNVTDTSGGAVSYTYAKNDAYQSIAAPAGENPKRKQSEHNSVGWLTSVCEVTAGTTSWPGGSCAQVTPQTGYWTKYSYDGLGNLATVTQNAQGTPQTRSFGYDMLSRPTSEVNPETGTTVYSYDSVNSGGCVANNAGDMMLKTDANGNGSCYVYDSLNRLSSVGLTSGSPNASGTPDKCFVYDSATVNGVSMANAKTRLVEAYTVPHATGCGAAKSTDEFFSYSARGEITDTWESTPHSGGYYHPAAGYWANGGLKSLSVAGIPAITYGADGEGRMSTVSASTGQNPVTATTYNVFGEVTGVTFGSADADTFTFDSNSGRMTQYKYSVNAASEIGNLTWNPNASLKTLAITDPLNAGDAQTCNYTNDDMSRIASANCGTVWSQTFSYDPFGNITKSGSLAWMPGYTAATNRYALGAVTYDANGDLLNDTFHAYGWDAAGKMVTMDSTALTYDAFGRMAEQNISGTYTQVVYSPMGKRLGLFRAQGVQQVYVPLPGGDTAEYVSWGLSHYRHADWLGTDRLEVNTSRAMVGDNAYAPFGEPYAQTGNGEISFTGADSKTVWPQYDFLFRQYQPQQSRWVSPDPAGLAAANPSDPQTWNRYAYVRNSPLSFTDPLGLILDPCGWDCGGGGGCDPFFDPACGCDPFLGCDPFGGGGGGGGGDGGGGGGGAPAPPTPPDQLQRFGGRYGSTNNETLGLPPGINFKALSLGDLFGLNPNGPCDFGVCMPIGMGATATTAPLPLWWAVPNWLSKVSGIFSILSLTLGMEGDGPPCNMNPDLANTPACQPKADRCTEVIQQCKNSCADQYANDRLSLPGSGPDFFGRIRRCIRECAASQGCSF